MCRHLDSPSSSGSPCFFSLVATAGRVAGILGYAVLGIIGHNGGSSPIMPLGELIRQVYFRPNEHPPPRLTETPWFARFRIQTAIATRGCQPVPVRISIAGPPVVPIAQNICWAQGNQSPLPPRLRVHPRGLLP